MSALLSFQEEVARLAGLQSIPINDDDLYEVNVLTGRVQRSYGCASNMGRLVISGRHEATLGYAWLKGTSVKVLQDRLERAQKALEWKP